MQDERFNSEQLGSDSSKIHVKKFILPVALIAVGIFDSSKAALPVGVTFDMRKGIRISAANARLLNDQVAAVDSDKHIEEYTTLLQSDQIADRFRLQLHWVAFSRRLRSVHCLPESTLRLRVRCWTNFTIS